MGVLNFGSKYQSLCFAFQRANPRFLYAFVWCWTFLSSLISQDELKKNSGLTHKKLPHAFEGKCQVSQKYISGDIFFYVKVTSKVISS